MSRFSSIRVRLVGIVLLAVAPALAFLVLDDQPWLGFAIGMVALTAAWVGGELFVLRQVKALHRTVKALAAGDLSARAGLLTEATELGDVARSLDEMAAALERQIREREQSERRLLNRAHQQTAIAALGQVALVSSDIGTLLNQAVLLLSQTLELEYTFALQCEPDNQGCALRAGHGWKEGRVGNTRLEIGPSTFAGLVLSSSGPMVMSNASTESRFVVPPLLVEHGVISCAAVVIQGQHHPFGILGVATARARDFSEEEVYFLIATATLLAMAAERQRTEPEIQKLAAFAKYNPNPVLEFSNDGALTFFNDATEKLTQLLGQSHPRAILPPDTAGIVQTRLATGRIRPDLETRPGNRILSWSFYPLQTNAVVHCHVADITDRTSLEEQLRQAQKMESVGQLAAGVAHDFNNILTIIQGHASLLMARHNLSPAMTSSIQAVSFAAERAVSLTRQLLMFSRKQVTQPKLLDLKEVVNNLSKMLQRLLGETVMLTCKSAPQLPAIKGDTGMIEQILMNLAVNARDAMPKGGILLIGVDPLQIDEHYAKLHAYARPGSFVCLQVSDTGTGMDAATIKRIFEPFFTTKGGKGTGLGLATVYGIVKQHSGWIEVQSEVGKGTTFKIFLPAVAVLAPETAAQGATFVRPVRGGNETILVVEDEPVLRDLAQLILQDCGYHVLDASSGVEALTVWQQHQGVVDLLLTDMIMPDGLSGKDLAESLLGFKPGLKIIFTSGYNVEDIGADLPGRQVARFLQKPYSRSTLAQAVRECLDA